MTASEMRVARASSTAARRRRIAATGATLIAGAVTTLTMTACGSSGPSAETQVAATLKTYLAALAAGDGQRACGQLTGDEARTFLDFVVSKIPEASPASCADAISKLSGSLGGDEKQTLRDAKVINVRVTGTSATADLQGGSMTAQLTRDGRLWLISGGITG